jgi:hypothetical protein
VIPFGFEPKTYCLEGSCSIQLSYGTIKKKGMIAHPQSGRQDSNLRPPGPKPGAMTGLRYAPNESSFSIFVEHQPMLMCFFNLSTNPAVSHPFQPSRYCGGSGISFGVFASLRHEPCGFSSLPTFTLLRWERDFLRSLRFATARTLRFLIPSNLHVIAVGAGFPSESSLRYGTNPAVSHPFQPSRYCGGSGIRTRGTVTRTTV